MTLSLLTLMLQFFRRLCALPVLLLLLAGCQQADMIRKLEEAVPMQDQQLAMHYSGLLREKQLEQLSQATDPGSNGDAIRNTMAELSDIFPAGEPKSVKVVGYHRFEQPGGPQHLNIILEYEFADSWIVNTLVLKRYGTDVTIIGLGVLSQNTSLQQQATFSLHDKSALHYLVLCMAILFPLLTLYALVICWRSKLTGRKWPWLLFIIVGFGKLILNWGTGQWWLMPLSVQLFSVGAQSGAYVPWTLSVALPVGAIVFLCRRKQLIAPVTDAAAPAST